MVIDKFIVKFCNPLNEFKSLQNPGEVLGRCHFGVDIFWNNVQVEIEDKKRLKIRKMTAARLFAPFYSFCLIHIQSEESPEVQG